MLSETVFEKINDDYSCGAYDKFKVIIMNKTGYINATKLCSEYNKRFDDWLKNDSSKELIKEVDELVASPRIVGDTKSTITITGKLNVIIRGTIFCR